MPHFGAVVRSQKMDTPVRDASLEGEAVDFEEWRDLQAENAVEEEFLTFDEIVGFCRGRKAQAEDHQKTF